MTPELIDLYRGVQKYRGEWMIPQLIRDNKRIKAGNQLRKRWWRYNMDALHLKYGEFWPKGMTVVDGDEYPPCMPQRDRVKDFRSWIRGNRRTG